MKLHYTPGTISIAVAIALEEAGAAYDSVPVDFARAEQTQPAYLAMNPKGRVPTLDVDGTLLTETGAILDYVGTLAPALVPEDALDAAHMRSVMYYLASTMHVNHAHKMRGHRWADNEASWADMTAKVPETMTASAAFVESHALRGTYVTGGVVSLADPYLFAVCRWLPGDDVDLAPFPRIRAFMDAMEGRASVQAIRAKGMIR
ncbi:MAG: glutathione S-transferase family protein [Pseudomonadota bacterium]